MWVHGTLSHPFPTLPRDAFCSPSVCQKPRVMSLGDGRSRSPRAARVSVKVAKCNRRLTINLSQVEEPQDVPKLLKAVKAEASPLLDNVSPLQMDMFLTEDAVCPLEDNANVFEMKAGSYDQPLFLKYAVPPSPQQVTHLFSILVFSSFGSRFPFPASPHYFVP